MRVYAVDLDGDLNDLRGVSAEQPLLCHPDNYGPGQALARQLREGGSNGIAYDSVREAGGGACAAVFQPRLLANARHERHFCYVWSGQEGATLYEKRALSCAGQQARRRARLEWRPAE